MKAKHKEQNSRETQQRPHTKERQGMGEGGQAPGRWPERLSGTAHLFSGNQRPERTFSGCHLRSLTGITEGIVSWYSV